MNFTTPFLEPGIYPFWFLNDRLDAGEVARQIAEMAEQGIRGFYLHSRQGLEQPYMSESFFEMLDVALREAEKHRMTVHFYDEYPYPSGIAGGEVTAGNPQFYATELQPVIFECESGFLRRSFPAGKLLSCETFPVRDGGIVWKEKHNLLPHCGMSMENESFFHGGLTPYNRKRYFTSDPLPTLEFDFPPGVWHVTAAIQIVVENHKYWGNFVDPLNPKAIAEFIRLTHERYYARYGKYFGTLIRSIFTDETNFSWSRLVPERFRQEYGYDLQEHYTAYLEPEHPDHKTIFAELQQLMYRMFCDSYDRQLADWCKDHNIFYCGEKVVSRFAQYGFMDIPGCDLGHVKAGAGRPDTLRGALRENGRAAASAGYFFGKQGCLCECFHSLGWSGTLQDAKYITESLLMAGITHLVPHGFFYSTHALKKHDAPPTFFFQMPYYQSFGLLSKRLDVIWKSFENKRFIADTMLISEEEGLGKDYSVSIKLQNGLMDRHVEFVIGDAGVLAAGDWSEGHVRCRDLEIRTVVIPPLSILLPEMEEILGRLRAARVRVVEVPDAAALPEALAKIQGAAGQPWPFEEISGESNKLHFSSRTDGKTLCGLFLNNSSGETVIRFAAGAAAGLGEIPLSPEELPGLELQPDGSVLCRFAPYESHLLIYGEGVPPAKAQPVVRIPIAGEFAVTPRNLNLLRMNDFTMQILRQDDSWSPAATVAAMPLANQLAAGKFEYAPEYRMKFGRLPQLSLPELTTRYEYTFDNNFEGSIILAMEPGTIRGEWKITVNDAELDPDDFTPTDVPVRGISGAEITPHLRQGRNSIVIECRSRRMDGGLRNPLYLTGYFGVENGENVRLTPPVRRGGFEDYTKNKLPYFAGTIHYEGNFVPGPLPQGERFTAELILPEGFENAIRVSVNGGEWHKLPWNPRRFPIPAAELHPGNNRVELEVATTLVRAFEGQYFDAAAHCQRDIHKYVPGYKNNPVPV